MNQRGIMNKRIPTALALVILIAGLIAGVVLVNSRTSFQSKAGPTESPKNVRITNRSASGLSISWTTDIPMTGYIKYSEDPAKINLPAGDIRDQISGTSQNYTNHYVNITGLGANKTYYFVVGSGSQIYTDNGKPFQIRTQTALSLPAEDVISGKIVSADSAPTNGAIIFVDIEGAESLSTVSKNDGTWRLNVSTARSKDGKSVVIDPTKTLLSMFVQAGSLGTATAISSMEKAKPVPDIILGKNQSFVEATATLTNTDTTTDTNKGSGFAMTESLLSDGNVLGTTESVTFLNPAIEGELIATTSPEFKIKLTTGSGLTLSVGDQKNGSELAQNSAGEWVWSPVVPLSTGLNTLLVEFLDTKNNKQQVSRSFNVLSIGDTSGIPAFTATPSATPTLIAEVTPTPTEATTMPETTSENLVDSGTVEQSILATLSGLIIFMVGRKLKKKWN